MTDTITLQDGHFKMIDVGRNGIPDWLQHQLPTDAFLDGKTAGVLVMSDRASKGGVIVGGCVSRIPQRRQRMLGYYQPIYWRYPR